MLESAGFRALFACKGIILAVCALAMTNIAGDNIAVVPLMATVLRSDIYEVVFVAYFGVGACLAGISAWIGAVAKDELPQTVAWNGGKQAKDLLALVILGVCLPASALTGGYFAGAVFEDALCAVNGYGALCTLLLYSFVVLTKNKQWVTWINACSLCSIPLLIAGCLPLSRLDTGMLVHSSVSVSQWTAIWALVGYNAGGLRPILVTEASTYLNCPWTAVGIAVLAKWLEGGVTLLFAYAVVRSGAAGLLPLGQLLETHWGEAGRALFIFSCFSVFFGCMVPAMALNAHQIKGLTGVRHVSALVWSLAIVLSIVSLGLEGMLGLLAVTGLTATMAMLSILWRFVR